MSALKPNTKPVVGIEAVENGFIVNLYVTSPNVGGGFGALLRVQEEKVDILTHVFPTLADVVMFLATHFGVGFNSDKAIGVN